MYSYYRGIALNYEAREMEKSEIEFLDVRDLQY